MKLGKRELIGHVAVDSGQLMVCDPCYVDSGWTKKGFAVERRYKDKDGEIFEHGKDFYNFESVLTKYGKSVNDLIQEKVLEQIPHEDTDEFNYDGCCRKTLGKEGAGCIQNGTATVFASGYGDGVYNVYARRNYEGRIMEVIIKMH